MKLIAVGVLIAAVLFFGGYSLGKKNGKTYMDVNVLIGSVKDSVNAEEKYTEFVWYKACPSRIDGLLKPPRVLMVYPANFEFKTSIDEAVYTGSPSGKLQIRFAPIRIENTEPYIEQMAYLSSGGLFYQKGDRYIQAEINRAPRIIKFLAYQALKDNLPGIQRKMEQRVTAIFASALKNQIKPDRIECIWDDMSQKKYLEKIEKNLVQPPFGARGCEANWFHVGNKTYNYTVEKSAPAEPILTDSAQESSARPEKMVMGIPVGSK